MSVALGVECGAGRGFWRLVLPGCLGRGVGWSDLLVRGRGTRRLAILRIATGLTRLAGGDWFRSSGRGILLCRLPRLRLRGNRSCSLCRLDRDLAILLLLRSASHL